MFRLCQIAAICLLARWSIARELAPPTLAISTAADLALHSAPSPETENPFADYAATFAGSKTVEDARVLSTITPAIRHYAQKETTRTERVLKPFISVFNNLTTEGPTWFVPQEGTEALSSRLGAFCYVQVQFLELGRHMVLVRTPIPKRLDGSPATCVGVHFPTNSTTLGLAEIVFDVNAHPNSGNITSLDNFTISKGGMHFAYRYTTTNSSSVLEVQNMRTGHVVVLSQSAGLDLAWSVDDSKLYYLSNPDKLHWRLMLHALGTEASSDRIIHATESTLDHVRLHSTQSHVLAKIGITDANNVNSTELYVMEQGSSFRGWKRLLQLAAKTSLMVEEVAKTILASHVINREHRTTWYIESSDVSRLLQSDKDALEPSAVHLLELPGYKPLISMANDACLVRWVTNDHNGRFAIYRHDGTDADFLLRPPLFVDVDVPASGFNIMREARSDGLHAVVYYSALLQHMRVYSMDCTIGGLVAEKGVPFVGFDSSPYEERFERIPSKNPTKQGSSLHLVYRRDRVAFNGANPTLLLLGDAFWLAADSKRLSRLYALIDSGFVLALTKLPGQPKGSPISDAEYLANAETTVGDIRAAVKHLVALGYSTFGKIAALGYSHGALPLAALTNREPKLFGAAIIMFGSADPLTPLVLEQSRMQVDSELLRRARLYSPSHGVREAGDYPPVLVLDVIMDGNLNSLQTMLYGYNMQQATQGKNETLLYLEDAVDVFRDLEEVDPPNRFFPCIVSHALKSLCPGWQAATGCL